MFNSPGHGPKKRAEPFGDGKVRDDGVPQLRIRKLGSISRSIMPCLRLRTLLMSVLTAPVEVPKCSAFLTRCATRALQGSFLEGKQATAGHEPPTQRRLHGGDLLPGAAEVPGKLLAALAAAKNHNVKMFDIGHDRPPSWLPEVPC